MSFADRAKHAATGSHIRMSGRIQYCFSQDSINITTT